MSRTWRPLLFSWRDFLLYLSLCLSLGAWGGLLILAHKFRLVHEIQHDYYVAESHFMGRKLEEMKAMHEREILELQCQYDVAVAGIRSGHRNAYFMRRAGVFESCQLLDVGTAEAQKFDSTTSSRSEAPPL